MISGSIRPRDPDLWVKSPADFELLSLMKELLFLKRPTYVKSQQGSRNSIFTFLKLVFQAWSSIYFDLFLWAWSAANFWQVHLFEIFVWSRELTHASITCLSNNHSTWRHCPKDALLRTIVSVQIKSLAFCLKHQKGLLKIIYCLRKNVEINRWR